MNEYDPKKQARLRKIISLRYPRKMLEFEIALNTGMRRSEQYSYIDWSCVDHCRDLFIPESKSGKSRHVPLNSATLAAHQELHKTTGGEDPIFAIWNGRDSLHGPRHWFEDAISEDGVRDVTWHDLRHTFARRLVMTRRDLRTVAELMGHANIQMTMLYSHLAPAHKQAAAYRLVSFGTPWQKSAGTNTSTSENRQAADSKLSNLK